MPDEEETVPTVKLVVGIPIGIAGAFFWGAAVVGGVPFPWVLVGGLAWIAVLVLLARWDPQAK